MALCFKQIKYIHGFLCTQHLETYYNYTAAHTGCNCAVLEWTTAGYVEMTSRYITMLQLPLSLTICTLTRAERSGNLTTFQRYILVYSVI